MPPPSASTSAPATVPAPPRPETRKSSPTLTLVYAGCVLAVILAAGVWVWTTQKQNRPPVPVATQTPATQTPATQPPPTPPQPIVPRAEASSPIDEVLPGDQVSETKHHLLSASSVTGNFKDRNWRDARSGGWFSYELQVDPKQPLCLVCTYWGEEYGARNFDILVDGVKIATEKLGRDRPNEFWKATYPIPPQLTRDKSQVTVKFQAHPGELAGGVFDLCCTRR